MALIEHLEKLRHFNKIAQYKSINETANSLGLSQGGLSKSLLLLEDELGCKLFIRSRDGLTLTKEGEEVLKVTKSMIVQASELETRLKSLRAARSPQKIRIGMYDSIAIYFGIELQKFFKIAYPNVELILEADSSSSLKDKVSKNNLDVVIGVNFKSNFDKNLVFFELFEDFYSFYQQKGIQENQDQLIIYDNASDEKGTKIKDLVKFEAKNKTLHLVQNFETLKQLVLNGFGVGVLPTLVANPALRNNQLEVLEPKAIKKQFGKHNIGILVSAKVHEAYFDFISDVVRLGHRWIKM